MSVDIFCRLCETTGPTFGTDLTGLGGARVIGLGPKSIEHTLIRCAAQPYRARNILVVRRVPLDVGFVGIGTKHDQ
jgi:hypothetical protein